METNMIWMSLLLMFRVSISGINNCKQIWFLSASLTHWTALHFQFYYIWDWWVLTSQITLWIICIITSGLLMEQTESSREGKIDPDGNVRPLSLRGNVSGWSVLVLGVSSLHLVILETFPASSSLLSSDVIQAQKQSSRWWCAARSSLTEDCCFLDTTSGSEAGGEKQADGLKKECCSDTLQNQKRSRRKWQTLNALFDFSLTEFALKCILHCSSWITSMCSCKAFDWICQLSFADLS